MPHRLIGSRREAALPRRLKDSCDLVFRAPDDEKKFLELPLTGLLRLPGFELKIFFSFTQVHLLKARNLNPGFLRDFIESGACLQIRRSDGNQLIASRAPRSLDGNVEITLWKEQAAAIFGDERMAMGDFPPQRFELGARAGRENYPWNSSALKLGNRFLRR